MLIAPIILRTVVVGIAKMGDMKDVGRVGIKALIYFEAMSTVALIIGLVVVNVLQPGAGINADPATLDTKAIAIYATAAQTHTTEEFLMNIIPSTVVDAFAKGEILQVLLFAILFGMALNWVGKRGGWTLKLLDEAGHVFFRIIEMIMQLAPIGAGAAMAFTVGKYGLGTLLSLGKLMAGVYATCFLFVFVVLGRVARLAGFSLWRFLVYIREEIFIVLGTSSSESVLPRMMEKLERLGLRPIGGRTGHSHRLFVQSRRHVDLSDDGGDLHSPSDERSPDARRSADHCRGSPAHLEGSGGGDRRRLHHARGHLVVRRQGTGGGFDADPGRRPFHVGSPGDHQPHRQRRRDGRRVAVGEGIRCRQSGTGARRRLRRGSSPAGRHCRSRRPCNTRCGQLTACPAAWTDWKPICGASVLCASGVDGSVRNETRCVRRRGSACRGRVPRGDFQGCRTELAAFTHCRHRLPGWHLPCVRRGLAQLLTRALDFPVAERTTEGPSDNIELIESGEAQIGFVTMGVALQGWNGTGDWTHGRRFQSMRALFPMYDTPFTFAVPKDSAIQSLAGIAGKRIGVGPKGGTAGTYIPQFLTALKIEAELVYGTWDELAAQFQTGGLDVLAAAAGAPFRPWPASTPTRRFASCR